jgi:hypothetical protein
MSSLCFAEAAAKRKVNEITEDEYLQAIVNHCTGVRHGKNGLCNNDAKSDDIPVYAFASNIEDDSFAYAMANWIIRDYFVKQIPGKDMIYLSYILFTNIRLRYLCRVQGIEGIPLQRHCKFQVLTK